jgi:hypothetical protein
MSTAVLYTVGTSRSTGPTPVRAELQVPAQLSAPTAPAVLAKPQVPAERQVHTDVQLATVTVLSSLHERPELPRLVAERPLPRLRITARGRAVLMVLVAAPIVAASLALALNGGGAIATDTGSGAPLESVTVLSGQSLWQIAEDLAPHADPREFITDVLAVNTLASAEVRAGQRLEIPSEYTQ